MTADLQFTGEELERELAANGATRSAGCQCERPMVDADGECSKCGRVASVPPPSESVAGEPAPPAAARVRRATVEAACARLGEFTTTQLAAELGLSVNAASGHIARLRRDGALEPAGGGYVWCDGGPEPAPAATNGPDPGPPTPEPELDRRTPESVDVLAAAIAELEERRARIDRALDALRAVDG